MTNWKRLFFAVREVAIEYVFDETASLLYTMGMIHWLIGNGVSVDGVPFFAGSHARLYREIYNDNGRGGRLHG